VASTSSTVNEGSVSFTESGTNLTAAANVTNGTATATLTLPANFAGSSYANGVINYGQQRRTRSIRLAPLLLPLISFCNQLPVNLAG
jgi:hypothetical protein